ncbi:MAG: hypothetical protein J6Z34_03115 [Clostridia bacterium]|nr:hypothetical protein [Clostridia bacterium]
MNYEKYEKLKKTKYTGVSARIFAELDYAIQVARFEAENFFTLIDNVVEYLDKTEYITASDVKKCEDILSPMRAAAKKKTVLCVAHAHIDINWLWGYNETVNITLSTLETMVKLMERYPGFTFAQSSAIVYGIVSKYRPALLEKIKKFIKEGRFEVSASTFVEADKNIPDGNSLILQTKYAKKYLSRLLDIAEDDLCIDFEPDTFGHSAFVPEILSNCGVKYYYHCRGNDMPPLYKWRAPSGKIVTVYREPLWYNGQITRGSFEHVPDFCNKYNINKMLFVYGVGDHGGGATTRDIELIEELSSYPIMANVKFGTYREFFDYISELDLPVTEGEQTEIFSGCYTSQSEIKKQNAITQTAYFTQETLCSFDNIRTDYDNSHATECLLANQFHDVVTGSSVTESFNFAMGRYQEAQAELGAYTAEALSNITSEIDTEKLYKNFKAEKGETAFGAGVGFGTQQVNFSNHIAYGNERAYTVFNQLNFARTVNVKLPLWDYYGDIKRLKVFDSYGKEVAFAVRNAEPTFYWYHNFNEFEITAKLPPLSYKSFVIRETPHDGPKEFSYPPLYQRTESAESDFVLENENLRVVFDRTNFTLKSLFNKTNNTEILRAPAFFSFDTEDTSLQMTAWYVGRIKNREPLIRNVKLIPGSEVNNLVSDQIGFEIKYGRESKMQVFVCLNKGTKGLDIFVNTDFFEKGDVAQGIPSLSFNVPVTEFDEYVCDVPLGTVRRKQTNKDVPCSSFAAASGIILISNGKHGFRLNDDTISLRLLRASCDPHPYPEYGNHVFDFGLYLSEDTDTKLLQASQNYRVKPLAVSLELHGGSRAADETLGNISDNAVCVSVNKEETLLFNAESEPITTDVFGKNVVLAPYELKRVKR